jgi:hypothetical protein
MTVGVDGATGAPVMGSLEGALGNWTETNSPFEANSLAAVSA